MKILRYFLFCFCGITLNYVQKTTTQNTTDTPTQNTTETPTDTPTVTPTQNTTENPSETSTKTSTQTTTKTSTQTTTETPTRTTTHTTTQTENVDLNPIVLYPMIAVAIFILIILTICYCVFRHPPGYEPISDVDSENALGSNEIASNSEERNPNVEFCSSKKRSSSQFKDELGSNEIASNSEESNPNVELSSSKKLSLSQLKGLPNENNECYMNCVFQSLASSKYFLKQIKSILDELPDSLLLKNTIKLIDGLNNTRRSANLEKNSKLLKKIINLINWTKELQQDAFEFLCALINKIHDEMKRTEVKLEPPLKIQLMHEICGLPIPNKIQYHIGLSVGLCGEYKSAPGVKIEFLIDAYFSASNIDEDPSKTTQLFFWENTPPVLLIHIQANKWSSQLNELVKPTYFIQYEKDLLIDLPVHRKGNVEKKKIKYKLVAVVHHMGTLDNGHYITYRNLGNIWILANDNQVQKKSFDENICPYILIYEED